MHNIDINHNQVATKSITFAKNVADAFSKNLILKPPENRLIH